MANDQSSSIKGDVVRRYEEWLATVRRRPGTDLPAMGTVQLALGLIERWRTGDFDLSERANLTPGGAQIRGAGLSVVHRALERHGETQPATQEGGRTSRGAIRSVQALIGALRESRILELDETERTDLFDELQVRLVAQIRDYHAARRLEPEFDPAVATWRVIRELIAEAQKTSKGGVVAQHLVGAKLARRHPNLDIPNHRVAAADAPTGRTGDFEINDTVFHVTLVPASRVLEKCRDDVRSGKRVYLLVPEDRVTAGRQLAAVAEIENRMSVQGLEVFVGQNLDELAEFSLSAQRSELRALLEKYNERVAIENDPSLLISIPQNL